MTTTPATTMKTLEAIDLKALARREGPAITLQIPEFRPGAGEGSRQVLLRQLTQTAIEKLRNFSTSRQAAEMEIRLQAAADRLIEDHGGPAMTLFFAPDFEAAYLTPGAGEMITVGSRFHLVPLVATALAPSEVFALGISRKHIRLWRVDESAIELPLPTSIPSSLDAAGEFDRPDHDLENRSSAGVGTGHMKRVRFGTLSDHDSESEYMHKFMNLVYKGVRELARSAPLFLVGVREDLLEFRRAARQNGILEAEWHTNPEHCSDDEVRRRAQQGALSEAYRAASKIVEALRANHTRFLDDPAEIFHAAREGRVHRLFIAELASVDADQPPETGLFPGENLLNAAAVETLRNGGDVFVTSGTTLATGGVAAALVRY